MSDAPPLLMTSRQVCETLGVSRTTVYNLRRRGEFPEPIRGLGAHLRWRRSTVEAWLDAQEKATPVRGRAGAL